MILASARPNIFSAGLDIMEMYKPDVIFNYLYNDSIFNMRIK